ncbi:MAG: site-specific integrase [Bdellovibrionales bacterium]
MQGKITRRTVDALKAPASGEILLWDTEIKGFGIRVRASGVKTYIFQYRMAGGRGSALQKHTIGKHGSLTPEKAREIADELVQDVKHGKNPVEEKAKDRQSMTVAALCDLYLDDGCGTKKPSTILSDRGRIDRHIKPLLGKKKAKDVMRADVQKFLQDVATGKTACDVKTKLHGRAIVEGGKGTATRTVGLLGGIFTFAVERNICSINPVRGVKRYKDHKSERFLSDREVTTLGEMLSKLERSKAISPLCAAAIRLLLLTGCRKSEILSLKWNYIDFDRGYLRLPDSKTGEKAVPLGAPALQILSGMPRISDWVFPALSGDGYMSGLPKVWERVRKKAALQDVRLHDLRHSFASFGAAAGDSLLVIGKLLGHKDSKTTSRYAHLSDDPVKAAANRISNAISAAMKLDVQKDAQVVQMPKRKT